MMRAVVALVMVVPLLAGCLVDDDEVEREFVPPDVGYDATEIHITGVQRHEVDIVGFGGATLSTIVYEPLTTDTPDGKPARFPVVVFGHPFGTPKETFEYLPLADDGGVPLPPTNLLEAYAQAGIIAVSYDQRGWFRSGGQTTIAGPAEQADIELVIDYIDEHYSTNGRVGLTGMSYGGGISFLGWQNIPEVVTAVPINGWVDLYEGVVPGNVPKLVWAAELVGVASVETGGAGLGDTVPRWVATAVTRQDMDALHDEMELRNTDAARVDKPIFTCQGLQETLFWQSHLAWQVAPNSRALYFTGGHDVLSALCFERSLDWFLFWLAGIDTGVDAWPALTAMDVTDENQHEYDTMPPTVAEPFYLSEPGLTRGPEPNNTFSVDQRIVANPLHEPSAVWDLLPQPFQDVPEGLRQDPSGVFFESGGFDEAQFLIGAPTLTLQADNETRDGPWQVAATLYLKHEGNLRMLGRSAHAVLDSGDHDNGTVSLAFGWTHAAVFPGDTIVVKIASNDPTIFGPLTADYTVTFTGESHLLLPFFHPPDSPRGD